MTNLVSIIWMLFALYALVLFAVLADLWSGIRKARQRHEVCSSYGLRRTVDKLCRYYNIMLILTIIDAMQIFGVWYLDTYYGYKIPVMPIITVIGALGLGFIELKSIYEKAEDKEIRKLTNLIGAVMSNKDDAKATTEAIIKYLNETK